MDEITIGDKVYVSSKQAAKITGYAKDYVGQLCREGRIEARLVGRNWYVLETALREHRFGKKEEEATPVAEETQVAPVAPISTWQKPQYEAEVPTFVPDLAPKVASQAGSVAIADMQSAWKEWFEEKKPRQEALPDGQEDFKDEYLPVVIPEEPAYVEEEPVAISRVQATEEPETPYVAEEEDTVTLHRSYASMETGERVPVSSVPVVDLSPRTRREAKERVAKRETSASSSRVLQALFIVLAVTAVLIAIVGTGNAERLLAGTSIDNGVQKNIVDFLGGASTYESSL